MAQKVYSIEGKGLRFNNADDIKEIAAEIAATSDLTEVRLCGNTFGIDACKAIALALHDQPSLQVCVFSDMFTGRLRSEIPSCVTYFVDALLKNKPKLRVVDFSDNAFGPDGVRPLVPLISQCITLEEIRLNNTGLGPDGGLLLAGALLASAEASKKAGSETKLKVLVAGRSRLENGSMDKMAKAFESHSASIQEIRIPQNGIRPKGINTLMAGLKKCTKLVTLDVQDNTFTMAATRTFSEALSSWPLLVKLNVGDCMLGAKGSLMVIDAMSRVELPVLQELNLQYNEMTEAGALALAPILNRFPTLVKLELNGNCFESDSAGADAINDALANEDVLGTMSDMEEEDSDAEEETEEVHKDTDDEDESAADELADAMAKVSV